jgi:hypothetical protein
MMTKYRTGQFLCAVLAILSIDCLVVSADIIPANRRITWNPGIPGGVPNRTNIFANVRNAPYNAAGNDVADDTLRIQSALYACPSNQVVYIPAGKYRINGALNIPSGITVRGDGPGLTIIDAYGGSSRGALTFGQGVTGDNGVVANVLDGATAGASKITVSSTAGMAVGGLMILDELNDTNLVTILGYYGTCAWCSRLNGTRALGQIVEVTSISNNTVSFTPPLYWTYNSNLAPQTVSFYPGARYAGAENLTVRCNNSGYQNSFDMEGVAYCWLKNVESDYCDGDHADILWSFRCEVRDSYFHDAFVRTSGTVDQDVMLAYKSSACLVENNIFWRLHTSVILSWGAAGNVISYNYMTNMFDSYSTNYAMQDSSTHGAHPTFNLWEGNMGIRLEPDGGWGSTSHGTAFRNVFTGSDTASGPLTGRGPVSTNYWTLYQGVRSIMLDNTSWYYNIVGNILGSPYFTNHSGLYMVAAPQSSPYETPIIWRLGYAGSGDPGGNLLESTNTLFTLLQHGNFDYVTGSVKWDPTIPDTNLPASYYLSSKPSWFGNRTWPPVDPLHPLSASVTNLPAGYRFVFGTNAPADNFSRRPPVAVASVAPSGPLTASFSSLGSFAPAGVALSYRWSFGDGAISTAPNPSHTYQLAGNYQAQLMVADGLNRGSNSVSVTVTNQ